MTTKDKIIVYLYNKGNQVEGDFEEHTHYMRFHKLDEVDYLESIIRKVRKDTVKEIVDDLMKLLT